MSLPIQRSYVTPSTSPTISPWSLVEDVIRQRGLEYTFNKTGLTPLEASIALKDLDLCKKVAALQGGLDPQKTFDHSLLYGALYVGDESIALWLIEKGVDIHLQNSQGINYLHVAAQMGQMAVAKTLVEKGLLVDSAAQVPFPAVPEEFEELREPWMLCTPLYLAVACRQQEMVKWLLTQGADGNKGTTLCTPFLAAFINNMEEILPLFNKTNFNFDGVLLFDMPILHYYILTLNEDSVEKILKLGANPNLLDTKHNIPLHLAISIKHGAELETKHGAEDTPQNRATRLKADSIFKLLVDNGADLNIKNEDDETPLYVAFLANQTKFFHYLLEKGANPNLPSRIDATPPLGCASLLDSCDIAELLVKKGSSVNASDNKGNTPLHLANSEVMVKILLDAGAEARIINKKGYTPLGLLKIQPSVIGQQFLRLQQLDGGLTNAMHQLKLLGHRFSLKGQWMEGFFSSLTFHEMGISLQEFLPKLSLDLQKALQPLPSQFLESAQLDFSQQHTFEPALLQWKKTGKLLILPLGWEGHSVPLVIKGRYLIKGNCGEGAEESGMTVFDLKDTEKCYQGLLKLIEILEKKVQLDEIVRHAEENEKSVEISRKELQAKNKQEAIQYFNHSMIEVMGLNKLDHLRQKGQKSGNCTWKAAKMSFQGALIAHFLEQKGDLKEAIQDAKKVYARWKNFDNERALKQLVDIIQEPIIEKEIGLDNLFHQIFRVCAKKKKSSLTKLFIELFPSFLTWKEPKTGQTVMHLAEDVETIKFLIEKKVDPFSIDNKGENAFHFALDKGNMPLVRFFVEELKASLFEKVGELTPLHLAIYGGHVEPVYYLLSKGAISKEGAPLIPVSAKSSDETKTSLIHVLLHYPLDSIFLCLIHLIKNVPSDTLPDLLDSEGNNLLHLISYHTLNPKAENLLWIIQEHAKEYFQVMWDSKNHAGKTPWDIANELLKNAKV